MSIPPGESIQGPAPDARLVTISYRVFCMLLVCYPPAFRGAFGHDMAVVFRDASRAAYRRGRLGAMLGLWRVALPDLLVAATQERMKEGIQMNRQGLLRFSALSIFVAGAAQVLFALIRVAFYTGYAVSYAASNGAWGVASVVQSPLIGYGAVSLVFSPTTLVFLLIGMVGLHRLGNPRLGAVGWIAITLVVIGLAVEIGGAGAASAVSWHDLSQCLDPRNCGVSDSTGLFQEGYAASMVGVLVAGIGFALYGIAMLRSRLLPRGNILPVLLGVVNIQPLLLLVIAVANRPYDMRMIDASIAIGLESLLMAILIILFSRALLRASPALATA